MKYTYPLSEIPTGVYVLVSYNLGGDFPFIDEVTDYLAIFSSIGLLSPALYCRRKKCDLGLLDISVSDMELLIDKPLPIVASMDIWLVGGRIATGTLADLTNIDMDLRP